MTFIACITCITCTTFTKEISHQIISRDHWVNDIDIAGILLPVTGFYILLYVLVWCKKLSLYGQFYKIPTYWTTSWLQADWHPDELQPRTCFTTVCNTIFSENTIYKIVDYHWSSFIIIDYQWFSLIIIIWRPMTYDNHPIPSYPIHPSTYTTEVTSRELRWLKMFLYDLRWSKTI